MHKVTFLPSNNTVEVPNGNTILQAATALGLQVQSACGGKGTCGKCKVRLTQQGEIAPTAEESKFLSQAELAEGWVLACKRPIYADMVVVLPEQKDAFSRKTGLSEHQDALAAASSIHKYFVQLARPSVTDQTPDWERLSTALPVQPSRFVRSLAASLPQVLHKGNFQVTAVLDGEDLVAVEPGDTRERSFGLAIDIGTTTVVAYLLDLNQGRVVGNAAVTNPQNAFGADVISRITHAAQGSEQLLQIQQAVISGLNKLIKQLGEDAKVKTEEIYQATVVGNTTMSHLFLGIDPTYLAPAPFIPVYRQSITVEAKELGLSMASEGKVIVLPNVAGYVGSDTVGVALAAQIDRLPGITLAIDIGTNGEMILAGKDRILTCSTAAGPAFEGAEIKFGMRAAEGAIEGVRIEEDVKLIVIANSKPRGICGSGLIDGISEMVKSGVVEASGRLASTPAQLAELPSALRERLRKTEQGMEFVLAWGTDSATKEDIVLTQKDIRQLQLAKGAIMAGVRILMSELGITEHEIDRVLLAGAFGNYINKESALGICLLPKLPLEKITAIGNAAGDGAKLALLSIEERERANTLARRSEHIELSNMKEFQDEFIMALSF